MTLLGIGGLGRNAAVAASKDGVLVAAIEQLKLARGGSPGPLPLEAIDSCLQFAGTRRDSVDVVAVARPFPSEAELHLALRTAFPKARIVVADHHMAHAAAAYYLSPYESATVLTLDNQGDFCCGARWRAEGNTLRIERESYYPDSVGALYSQVTSQLGFQGGGDEQKVQWLSAGGTPKHAELFAKILPVEGDWYGRRRLGSYPMLDGANRADVAASIQKAVEDLAAHVAGQGVNLCLGGGLFLNALLVASLERSGRFQNVFVQPAAGNAGTAFGALCAAWHQTLGQTRRMPAGNLCLGPEFQNEEIKRVFENCKLRFQTLLTTDAILDTTIDQLRRDRIVAWMQGRMEFGPRALGNRSILASPVNPYSTENLNVFIKHREPYRKFAASVPAELAGEYFEVGPNARYLATVGRVRDAYLDRFASAVLGDGLVRVHTVSESDHPLYWRLLHKAAGAFGMPVLFNTSFNLFGDPLVCTPRDAVRSFYSAGIDALVAGHFFVEK
ncbi:MAG: carbamoyltransferase [Acidobacteria bacterium]|nr:carbamoyltransferase [Acidobacteriota bacterium]